MALWWRSDHAGEVMSRLSFQFPSHLAEQVRAHAARLDRSVGWILVTAWRLAEPQIAKMVAPPKEPIQ